MRFSTSFSILISILLTLTSCGPAGSKSQITFSHILSDQSEWHIGAARWKELVEQKLGDEIKIRIVTNSSLSKNNQRTELEMVQAGTLGGSWESTILLTAIDPKWTVWSMPWLFDSYDEAEKTCTSDLGQEMLKSLEEKGIVGLAYGFNGFRRLTNSKRAVASLEDLKGLKIRVPSIQMFISLFRLWGADPSQMNFGELILELRQGGMDGQENPLHVIESQGLYDLQKYLTMWEYSFDPLVFCISKPVWDQFTPEQQAALREAAQEACRYQRQTVVENEKKHLQMLEGKGMVITRLTPEARQQFKDAAQKMYQEYESVIGTGLLKRFVQVTEDPSNANSSSGNGTVTPGP